VCVCVCVVFFEIDSQKLFAQDWLQTSVLLISASWVTEITGVRYCLPAMFNIWFHPVCLSKFLHCLKAMWFLSQKATYMPYEFI
jgi:hypothetical protein